MSQAPLPPISHIDEPSLDFDTQPDRYRHWQLRLNGRVATLTMAVREEATLGPGYALKLNSYDLGVDIELYDAIQRLRFEHPEVAVVVITSANPRVFCAGANIGMLAQASHAYKVNFCKFTNETRNSMEDASAHSGQRYLCAINGSASGGGYELALACEHIILIDDGASAVSLPEVPLLAVLPGTGGLTRLVDKRHVRRDHADFFCTTSEGMRGNRALSWKLIDELAPRSRFETMVRDRAQALAALSDRPTHASGVSLTPLSRTIDDDHLAYDYLSVALDRAARNATFTVHGPSGIMPQSLEAIHAMGATFWPLAFARALEDAILHLRFNAHDIGTWVFRSKGDHRLIEAVDNLLCEYAEDWLVREITLYFKRVLQRLDVSSRSILTLIEPGSCYTGPLLELVLAADRSYMLDGTFDADKEALPATLRLTPLNFGPLPMVNAQTRLQSRFPNGADHIDKLRTCMGQDLDASAAERLGLVTFIPDDIDWEDEVRLAIEERASFSPDALTGMEANLRFAGQETIQSKVFGRLSAWQNWIFQRPNAVGDDGALSRYGTGQKSHFDQRRV